MRRHKDWPTPRTRSQSRRLSKPWTPCRLSISLPKACRLGCRQWKLSTASPGLERGNNQNRRRPNQTRTLTGPLLVRCFQPRWLSRRQHCRHPRMACRCLFRPLRPRTSPYRLMPLLIQSLHEYGQLQRPPAWSQPRRPQLQCLRPPSRRLRICRPHPWLLRYRQSRRRPPPCRRSHPVHPARHLSLQARRHHRQPSRSALPWPASPFASHIRRPRST